MSAAGWQVSDSAAPPKGWIVSNSATPPAPSGSTLQGTAPWQQAIDKAAQTEPYAASKGVLGNAKAFLNNLGAGAAGLLEPVAHPLDTLKNMASAVVKPADGSSPYNIDTNQTVGQAMGKSGAKLTAMIPGAALIVADPEALTGPSKASAATGVVNKVAEHMYGNALKPSTVLSSADRTAMIRTGLDNALPVSPAGVEKLGVLIDDLNTKIGDVIASDPSRTIDPNAVATRTSGTAQRFTNQVNAGKDLRAIDASRQQFLDEQGAKPGTPAIPPQPTGLLDAQGRPVMTGGTPATPPQPAPPMSAANAQSMKVGTYAVLREKYGEQGAAAVEAQKALARGLKEEIATQFPEINNLNASESRLLDLGPALERAVNRISNNHTIGIGGPILGTAVKAGTGSTGVAAVVGALKSVIDIPAIKSNLAIALSKGAKIPYPQALSRVSAYSASLQSAAHGMQDSPSGDGTSTLGTR